MSEDPVSPVRHNYPFRPIALTACDQGGLPCNELYRQMFNFNLYLYGNIYSNPGAMTPGASDETADGMSEVKINAIIEAMRHERYRFAPVRRVLIPKKNGKTRPLGLPTWSDKLVGEVARLLLEAYYEPTFSGRSHGFRKNRGCHTALREIERTWTGTVWFVEGDISDCFGSIDHGILVGILAEKIHDNRFLRLIRNMLKAGYLEDWQHHDTLSGTPQGALCAAEHKPPYEQCRVMRSAVVLALVTATPAVEHCA
ncbi:MAG TPA: reverse transcriptase/maturase family protein [Streptosporangiaceae bacterium]|nr:reverse transcriptase/maturase family protein [Streptosporangiaceae bacterium]